MSSLFDSRIKQAVFIDLQKKVLNRNITDEGILLDYCDQFKLDKNQIKVLTDLVKKMNSEGE